MSEYNGYRSWNAWNVSLWIANDEGLYFWAVDLIQRYGRMKAAAILHEELQGQRTPDGAEYNISCIRAALREL